MNFGDRLYSAIDRTKAVADKINAIETPIWMNYVVRLSAAALIVYALTDFTHTVAGSRFEPLTVERCTTESVDFSNPLCLDDRLDE